MRHRIPLPLLLLLLLTAGVGGCVRSMHPIYTEQTLTYDAALLGTWVDEKGDTRLEISASSGNDEPDAIKSYQVVHTDKDQKRTPLVAHLARVGELLVADLTIADEQGLPDSDFYRAHLFPLHTFWIVRRDAKQTMAVRTLDHDWMKAFVEKHPAAIAHYKSSDDVILTAPPEALQKFLLAHANDSRMLTEAEIFRRVKPAATAPTTATTAPPRK